MASEKKGPAIKGATAGARRQPDASPSPPLVRIRPPRSGPVRVKFTQFHGPESAHPKDLAEPCQKEDAKKPIKELSDVFEATDDDANGPNMVLVFTVPPGGTVDPHGALQQSFPVPAGSGQVLVSNGAGGIKFFAPVATLLGNVNPAIIAQDGGDFHALGLGSVNDFQYTPNGTGNLFITIGFSVALGLGTGTWEVILVYGDITAGSTPPPASQDLQSPTIWPGTVFAPPSVFDMPGSVDPTGFSMTVPVFGLTLGHTYWFDLGVKTSADTTGTFTGVQFVVAEI